MKKDRTNEVGRLISFEERPEPFVGMNNFGKVPLNLVDDALDRSECLLFTAADEVEAQGFPAHPLPPWREGGFYCVFDVFYG